MKEHMKRVIAARSDEDLLRDWQILGEMQTTRPVADVRELYMDEMERRWPDAFERWMDSTDFLADITDFR